MIAQACHAAFAFAAEHKELCGDWMHISNYIAILEIENEESLIKLKEAALYQDIRYSEFIEPDLDNQLTAIALQPGNKTKKLCSSLRLALKRK